MSTDTRALESFSLEAQRAKLTAYAAALDLQLVDITSDEGASGSTLRRPGLQRSVRDLGILVEKYLADGRCSLMSVSDSIDTRSASGRLVLNVLGSVAECVHGGRPRRAHVLTRRLLRA